MKSFPKTSFDPILYTKVDFPRKIQLNTTFNDDLLCYTLDIVSGDIGLIRVARNGN